MKHLIGKLSWQTPFARLSLWTLGLLGLLLISGSLVSTVGATPACQGWPLCQPQGWLGWLSLAHRVLVGLAGLAVLALFVQAWRTQRSQTAVLVAATASAVLLVAQSLMGALEVAQSFPPHLGVLHVASAIGVFVTSILVAIFAGLAKRSPGTEAEEARQWQARSMKGMARDMLQLTKPIVVALLLVTTYAGMVIGAQAWPSVELTFWVLLGGFMAAGGSGAINQYIDRQDDTRMQRTSKRPIPAGRLTPGEGLAFGVAMTLGSFYVMAAFVNFLAALLSLAGIFYYVVLYSLLLKKTTVQNIVIGGGAGALPPLVGWAAATGSLNIPSFFLFAVVFMWTPPHFWALAIVRRNDYARAGVPMLPVVRGERETRKQILIYTLELVGLTLLIPLFGLGGSVYFVLASILGLWLISAAWKVWKQEGNKVAWKMYRYSSMYLAFLFFALMIDALV
ncbi:MAG: protoheme IX farnesyltransferase [Anaerolineales bacterium]|nr:protoheme IX farnesyltransferase [Anaerolineales bacterium]